MVKLIKAVFLLILLILLAFLLSTTFLSGEKRDVLYNLQDSIASYQPGYYSLSGSGDIQLLEADIDTSSLYMQKISRFSNIYALENSDFPPYNTADDGSIVLGKGIYLLDLNNQAGNHKISSSGFEIQTLSSGKVYIDTRDISAITLLSLSASFELSFLDRVDESVISSSYIFPNRYIIFNTLRNNELRNADFFRVSQVVSKYGYLNEALLSRQGTLGERLGRLIGEEGKTFLHPVLTYIRSDLEKSERAYSELYDLSIWEFPGTEYIKEKLLIFKNDTKKIVFYKNIILAHSDDLLRSETKNPVKISEIKNNLDTLKTLDSGEHETMLELLEYYSALVFLNTNKQNRIQKQNFVSLLTTLGSAGDSMESYDSLLGLSDIYTAYNFHGSNSTLEDIATFNKDFFTDLGMQVEDGIMNSLANDNQVLTDYFSGYLQTLIQQTLLAHISADTGLDSTILGSILSILNDNIILGEYIYFSGDSLSRKETGLSQNETLLIILEKFLRNNLFEKSRSTNNLLVPKTNIGVRDSLSELNENTSSMFDLYDTYKSSIGGATSKLNAYTIIEDKLYEYFLAIRNYDRYTQEFDEVVKNIGDTDIFSGEESEGISTEEFLKYINGFIGVNTSQVDVKVIDGEYYRVSELYINGSRIDFELYPLGGNKIENITIDFSPINGSYNLDEREFDLEEKFQTARGDDKDKYDFRRFFLNTFFVEQRDSSEPIFIDSQDTLNESKLIIAFKKEKLLGEGKEFSFVANYLPLKWEQVIVTQSQESYDINITDALYVSQDTATQYHAGFNSKYIFTNNDHKFEDIVLQLYDDYARNKGEKLLLDASDISFIGPVHISEFNDISQRFFAGLSELQQTYSSIITELGVPAVQLLYYPENDYFKLDFNYQQDDISITLSGDDILFIKKNGKTIANSFKTSTLADVLKTL